MVVDDVEEFLRFLDNTSFQLAQLLNLDDQRSLKKVCARQRLCHTRVSKTKSSSQHSQLDNATNNPKRNPKKPTQRKIKASKPGRKKAKQNAISREPQKQTNQLQTNINHSSNSNSNLTSEASAKDGSVHIIARGTEIQLHKIDTELGHAAQSSLDGHLGLEMNDEVLHIEPGGSLSPSVTHLSPLEPPFGSLQQGATQQGYYTANHHHHQSHHHHHHHNQHHHQTHDLDSYHIHDSFSTHDPIVLSRINPGPNNGSQQQQSQRETMENGDHHRMMGQQHGGATRSALDNLEGAYASHQRSHRQPNQIHQSSHLSHESQSFAGHQTLNESNDWLAHIVDGSATVHLTTSDIETLDQVVVPISPISGHQQHANNQQLISHHQPGGHDQSHTQVMSHNHQLNGPQHIEQVRFGGQAYSQHGDSDLHHGYYTHQSDHIDSFQQLNNDYLNSATDQPANQQQQQQQRQPQTQQNQSMANQSSSNATFETIDQQQNEHQIQTLIIPFSEGNVHVGNHFDHHHNHHHQHHHQHLHHQQEHHSNQLNIQHSHHHEHQCHHQHQSQITQHSHHAQHHHNMMPLLNGLEHGGVIIQDINLASASWSSPEDLYSI